MEWRRRRTTATLSQELDARHVVSKARSSSLPGDRVKRAASAVANSRGLLGDSGQSINFESAETVILVFQDPITTGSRWHRWPRLGFLTFVLLWLGWYASAQLSVLNVLTFIHALLTGFEWEFFLLESLIFILWAYVAVALLLWGRGVFCGWLCPLGAAFAVPSKLRQFEWLKRHWQCGRQCQICAADCPVQAIHPEGQINPSECIDCLNCQVN